MWLQINLFQIDALTSGMNKWTNERMSKHANDLQNEQMNWRAREKELASYRTTV